MMGLLRPKLIFFVVILLLTLQSCAEMKSLVSTKTPAKPPAPVKVKDTALKTNQAQAKSIKSAAKPSAPAKDTAKVSSQAPANAGNQAKKLMEVGEYQKAIDIYSVECRKNPQDSLIIKEYAMSLDSIKSSADKALEKKDFGSAGKMYYVLHNNYAKFGDIDHMLSFDSTFLDTKLSNCKKSLSVQGFEEYRKGDINKALVLWQSFLAIDPDNTAIKEAVRTAKLQQKNL